ncbi:MAG: DUF1501 domain-containing protein [Burkholderiaceae bacterium]
MPRRVSAGSVSSRVVWPSAACAFSNSSTSAPAPNWDSHGNMADHERLAKAIDQPIAGLLTDLKQRGMLERTLVVWTSEFGRTPFHQGGKSSRTRAPQPLLHLLDGRRRRQGRILVHGEIR